MSLEKTKTNYQAVGIMFKVVSYIVNSFWKAADITLMISVIIAVSMLNFK